MPADRDLETALGELAAAIQVVEKVLRQMREEHDGLAVHIFRARRRYRHLPDSKGGRRHEVEAKLSWDRARELGFRGSLGEWARLLGMATPR